MVRYTESEKILDYLAEFNTRSVQSVEYGKNLTDVKITRDHTERITALIPLGAKKKTTDEEGNEVESDERVDITSVNDGLNYIYDDAAVKELAGSGPQKSGMMSRFREIYSAKQRLVLQSLLPVSLAWN